jgi:hypothetical protein
VSNNGHGRQFRERPHRLENVVYLSGVKQYS